MATIVQIRRPSTDENAQFLTSEVGADIHDMVNEAICDDDVTYMYLQATNGGQRFGFPSYRFTADSVNYLQLFASGRTTSGGDGCDLQLRIRVNNQEYQATPVAATESYVEIDNTWAENPNTTAAWTKEDINGVGPAPLQFIVLRANNNTTAGDELRYTCCRMEVSYEITVLQGPMAMGMIPCMGVF